MAVVVAMAIHHHHLLLLLLHQGHIRHGVPGRSSSLQHLGARRHATSSMVEPWRWHALYGTTGAGAAATATLIHQTHGRMLGGIRMGAPPPICPVPGKPAPPIMLGLTMPCC